MSNKPVFAMTQALRCAGVPMAEVIAMKLCSGGHRHTKGDPVVENLIPATTTTDGSYDSVIYCTECGEEVSRETIVLTKGRLRGWDFNGVTLGSLDESDGVNDWVNDTYPTLLVYDLYPEKTAYENGRYYLARLKSTVYATNDAAVTASSGDGQTYSSVYLATREYGWTHVDDAGVSMPLDAAFDLLWCNYDIINRDTGEVSFKTYTPIPVYK